MTIQNKLMQHILIIGLDDWIHFGEVFEQSVEVGGAHTADEALDVSLDAIRALLSDGLIDAGDVIGTTFCPWALGVDDTLARIAEGWRRLGRTPDAGDICWLRTTAEGDRIAEDLDW